MTEIFMDEILLCAKFKMLPSISKSYDVTLTKQNLTLVEQSGGRQQQGQSISILVDTIIGCKPCQGKSVNDVCGYFKVITLAKGKKGTRQRQVYGFRVDEENDEEGNVVIAERWARLISWLVRYPELSTKELHAKDEFPHHRRFYVVVNPVSGTGRSLEHFKKVIVPLLYDADILFEPFVTERAGHLMENAATLNYKSWDAIIFCSGDGLVFEYINGVMKRPDWEGMLQLPIGILPTGSGNGLTTSVLYAANEVFCLTNAIYVILKGISHPMNLFSLSTRSDTVYGFMTVFWGIAADVDIESERYRAIGALRFYIGLLQRIFNLRHYTGVFSYLPEKSPRHMALGVEMDTTGSSSASPWECNDGTAQLSSASDFTNVESRYDVISASTNDVEHTPLHGPKCSLPNFDEPLPEDWVTLDGEFVGITMTALTHIGSDFPIATAKHFGDGLMTYEMIKRGPKTLRLLQVLAASEREKEEEFPEVEKVSFSAFRLTPEPSNVGHIVVDGEPFNYEPIQGEVFPSLARVLLLPSTK